MSTDFDDHEWLLRAVALSHFSPPLTSVYSAGAVIVNVAGTELASGYSRDTNATVHAEESALARLDLHDPQVATATVYATLEPCTERKSRPTAGGLRLPGAGSVRGELPGRGGARRERCDRCPPFGSRGDGTRSSGTWTGRARQCAERPPTPNRTAGHNRIPEVTICMDADASAERGSSDTELVKAVAAGDQRAFAALYDRYCRQAYSLARRVCVEPEFAEEAVQEAFLAVWRAPGRFDPARGGFASWLLTLVHHRSVDVVRRQATHRKRTLLGNEDVIDQVMPPAAGADEKAIGGVIGGVVRDALRQLSPDQRQVIGLAYLGGYTQAEVSSITGLPLGTVKSRTFAGIKRLRHLLSALTAGHDNDEGWEVR